MWMMRKGILERDQHKELHKSIAWTESRLYANRKTYSKFYNDLWYYVKLCLERNYTSIKNLPWIQWPLGNLFCLDCKDYED